MSIQHHTDLLSSAVEALAYFNSESRRRVSYTTFLRWIHNGTIHCIEGHIGKMRVWVFTREEVDRVIKARNTFPFRLS
jgi:hypothetical protein